MDVDITPGASSAAEGFAKHSFPHPHLFEIVAEDVELLKKLKDDHMGLGELWRGKLLHLDVVVKAFPLTGMTNKDVNQFLAALQRAVAASLEGHHLARFYGWMLKDMKLCLVMRPYSGGLLKRILDRSGTMPFPEALKGGIAVAKSLVELHEAGLVAGNLKPHNVLFDNCGDFYLSDYGLFSWYQVAAAAKDADAKYKTIWHQYAAPEVMKYSGKEVISDKADVWSLACLLIHMLDSRPPWGNMAHDDIAHAVLKQGKRPTLPAKLPAKLTELLQQCLQQDAASRPTSKQVLTVLLDCMILYGFKEQITSDGKTCPPGLLQRLGGRKSKTGEAPAAAGAAGVAASSPLAAAAAAGKAAASGAAAAAARPAATEADLVAKVETKPKGAAAAAGEKDRGTGEKDTDIGAGEKDAGRYQDLGEASGADVAAVVSSAAADQGDKAKLAAVEAEEDEDESEYDELETAGIIIEPLQKQPGTAQAE